MRKDEMTKDFLYENIKKNYYFEDYTPHYWSKLFKDDLKSLIDAEIQCYKDDDNLDGLNNFLADETVKYMIDCVNDENYYINNEEYNDFMYYAESRPNDEIIHGYKHYVSKTTEIEAFSCIYANLIKTFPDVEYEIEFSKRSVSIYLTANLSPIKENRDKFKHLDSGINDRYEEDYDEKELKDLDTLEIRMSNHDMGGNEFISYYHTCISFILERRNR